MICAVIDDGVCITKYPFLSKLAGSVAVTENGIVPTSPPSVCTHGTYCAAIIRLYAPDIEILSVRVMNPGAGQGTLQDIREALAWCAEQPIAVINLSIGSMSLREWPLLRPVIAKLCRKGIPLVCAWPNHDHYSVYASHSWAISVQADNNLRDNQFYIRHGGFFEADFSASSRHTFPISEYRTEGVVSENSHATPVITAQVCNILKKNSSMPMGTLFRMLAGDQERELPFHLRILPNFLDTSVVIGSPTYPENLWFFQRDRKTMADAIHSGDPFVLAVFPVGVQESDVAAIIRRCKGALQGLLWAGIASESIKEAVHQAGCLFWDESEYQAALANLSLDDPPAEIFRINISGDQQKAIQLTKRLQSSLLEAGIRAVSFSVLPQAYCLGMIYLPKQSDTKTIVETVSMNLDLEIGLFCGESFDEANNDIDIFCTSDVISLSYEHKRSSFQTYIDTTDYIVKSLLSETISSDSFHS